jgi:prepilin-type N-terminal cleavage/methylation domain-containing protein
MEKRKIKINRWASGVSRFAFRASRRGFTLLELSVVIGVICILSAVSIVSLTSSRNIVKLQAAQSELASTIKLAQSYALQGKTQGSSTPAFYGVKFFVNSYAVCTCTTSGCANCSSIGDSDSVEKYSLQNGVTRSSGNYVSFGVPHGEKYPAGGNTVFTVQVGGKTKTVTVNSSGFVTEN